jgi:hypothetical protein
MTTKAEDNKKKSKNTLKKITEGKGRKSKTIAELAKEQGVKPFDFNKAGENWPEGADFDEFMKAINSGRKYPREY